MLAGCMGWVMHCAKQALAGRASMLGYTSRSLSTSAGSAKLKLLRMFCPGLPRALLLNPACCSHQQLQERIMTEPYGPPGAEELFKFSLFLVLCNRLTSCAVAVGSLLVSTCAAAGGVGG